MMRKEFIIPRQRRDPFHPPFLYNITGIYGLLYPTQDVSREENNNVRRNSPTVKMDDLQICKCIYEIRKKSGSDHFLAVSEKVMKRCIFQSKLSTKT